MDPLGKRCHIYANDLLSLREKEKKLIKDQLDSLDRYVTGRASINDVSGRYISTKYNLRGNAGSGYIYMYDRSVRKGFGKHKLIDIKYSDVLQYYFYLLNERNLALTTLDSVHCILRPTFQLVVRNDIIRESPTDGVMAEIKKKTGMHRDIRYALTVEQQKAFMDYMANHPVCAHWWPIFTILLGTRYRVGEALRLRQQDLDFEKGITTIDHTLVYYESQGSGDCRLRVSKLKTEAGIRTTSMLDVVRETFQILQDEEIENGPNLQEIDGYSGLIFQNHFDEMSNSGVASRAIKHTSDSYNAEEILDTEKGSKDLILLPSSSRHHLRHTFAAGLCGAESNLKAIRSVMGHKDIETTMDIYTEATDRKKKESFNVLTDELGNVF